MAMTSFTWFAWGPTLMDLVELFLYTRKIEFTPWSSKEQFMSLLSGCLKPSSYPLPRVIHLSSFFLFSHKDQRNNFLPLLFGCLKPFLLPSSNRNTLVLVFNIPIKIKGISVPSTKNSFTISSPRNIEWEPKMNDIITLGREEGEWKVNKYLSPHSSVSWWKETTLL